MRTHGHRAARIDPLDIIHREEVAAINPKRYGLTEDDKKFDVNGIIWTRPITKGDEGEGDKWTLKEIEQHLRAVYVGNIAYEVGTYCNCAYTHLTQSVLSICTLRRRQNASGSLIS